MFKKIALALALFLTPALASAQAQVTNSDGSVSEGVYAYAAITNPTNAPTISTSAYTAGFVLGGLESFTVPRQGTLQGVASAFATGAYVGGVDWIFFDGAPTGGGTTDHAALAITATDTPKFIGVIHATDCKLLGAATSYCQSGNSPLFARIQAIAAKSATGTITVVKQVIGAPTFTNATDDTDRLLYGQ